MPNPTRVCNTNGRRPRNEWSTPTQQLQRFPSPPPPPPSELREWSPNVWEPKTPPDAPPASPPKSHLDVDEQEYEKWFQLDWLPQTLSQPCPSPPRPQLPDSDKPPIPYIKGRHFTVRRHKPSMPLEHPYPHYRPEPPENYRNMTQLQYCLSNPILEGSSREDVFSFVITREIAVRDGRGAQVVLANDNMVAKIYDPLYYAAMGDYSGERADVVGLADCDYTREAAAYEELRSLWGSMVPYYYGSWTCNVATNTASGSVLRPVRLIFMEFINGYCMRDLDPKQLTEEQRSNIMVKAIEVETAITFGGGVDHRDFVPRNVLCSGSDLASPTLRVTAIDFNISIVYRLIDWPPLEDDLPVSPIRRWSGGQVDFAAPGWIPSNRKECDKWLWKHFGNSRLYQPVAFEDLEPPRPPLPEI